MLFKKTELIFFSSIYSFFFYEKSISNAFLDHLEAWIFKIAPSGQTMVRPPGDTGLYPPLKQKCFLNIHNWLSYFCNGFSLFIIPSFRLYWTHYKDINHVFTSPKFHQIISTAAIIPPPPATAVHSSTLKIFQQWLLNSQKRVLLLSLLINRKRLVPF